MEQSSLNLDLSMRSDGLLTTNQPLNDPQSGIRNKALDLSQMPKSNTCMWLNEFFPNTLHVSFYELLYNLDVLLVGKQMQLSETLAHKNC